MAAKWNTFYSIEDGTEEDYLETAKQVFAVGERYCGLEGYDNISGAKQYIEDRPDDGLTGVLKITLTVERVS